MNQMNEKIICASFWPLVVTSSKLIEAQAGEWMLICKCALKKLVDVCQRIVSGDVLVHELKAVSLKESQMSKLCAAAAGPSRQKNSGKRISQAEYVPPYNNVKMHLDIRLKVLDHFMKYRAQLKKFLHSCATIALSGKISFLCMI